MYVKDFMTKNPVVITKDTSIRKALDLMAHHDFHRLPVVDENGKLIGLVTGGLVDESTGVKSTSLSVYELNYLLQKTPVSDIMITDVVTIDPDAFVADAAKKMIDHKINVLPIIEADGKITGIITEKDIFQAFVELLGYGTQGTRFVFHMEDKPGEFAKVCALFAQENANLENLAIYHNAERGTEVVVKATGEVSVEKMRQVLVDAGYEITDIFQNKKDGTTEHFKVK
ncbi:CBS domain-containing protein [Erysipelotrichaceae bacterium Oil+RF-744-GAM-WT-6]|jgi:acetoin utilization protein AcuB|uniref:CBS domain-containing protein n=1 Tax=Stecheria intestinalis TaxID=2606630 RepID=A0A7X2TFW8_9FIRM|nr:MULTISPECIES: CBS and ACT domain-containing protein [Erysipelotrichaceae]MCI2154219.1 CBS and ACT domain-containing protein [Solobacterium sp.]MDY3233907.1 CBS and ACT domain-containing protein [Erysipelotrichaceae bacterium]MDY4681903.1 CBS and ACT domain-containing protein [Lachnospiraceae bacterium]MCI6744865.1 CBS and ACT domain-containing protein [Anaerolactibacter massiliensis]MDD5881335.1 CBS and ACT domain-containing protein [Stecheria intestinalis]